MPSDATLVFGEQLTSILARIFTSLCLQLLGSFLFLCQFGTLWRDGDTIENLMTSVRSVLELRQRWLLCVPKSCWILALYLIDAIKCSPLNIHQSIQCFGTDKMQPTIDTKQSNRWRCCTTNYLIALRASLDWKRLLNWLIVVRVHSIHQLGYLLGRMLKLQWWDCHVSQLKRERLQGMDSQSPN